jgi:hypothetical protein
MHGAAPANQRMERFNQAVEEHLLECMAPLAKNHMVKHVKELQRPVHAEPRDHTTRMETLVRCTNRLPGAEPNITPQRTKNMIFASFPVKCSVTNALAELVRFMANEQSFADDEDNGKKKDGDGDKSKESHHDGGCGKGGRKCRDREGGHGGRGVDHRDNER